MKWILMCVLLLCAGCGDDVPRQALQPARPATSTECGHNSAASLQASGPEAWVFRCKNLGSYPDTTIGLAPTNIPGSAVPDTLHPELIVHSLTGVAITEVDAEGNVEAYLYTFELFPPGSKFHKYGVTGTLLCADVNGSGFGPRFQLHTNNTLAFAGTALGRTEEARNLSFRKYGAQLVVGETDNAIWINGLHMTLPGKQGEVWLSHAAGL